VKAEIKGKRNLRSDNGKRKCKCYKKKQSPEEIYDGVQVGEIYYSELLEKDRRAAPPPKGDQISGGHSEKRNAREKRIGVCSTS